MTVSSATATLPDTLQEKKPLWTPCSKRRNWRVFCKKQALTIRWEDGVYDRLLLGQRSGRFDPEAPPLKNCRVWQLSRDSPINIRFVSYETMVQRFGHPSRKSYEMVYKSTVHGQLQRAWQVPPDLPLSAANE